MKGKVQKSIIDDQSKALFEIRNEWMVQGTTPMCGAGDPWQPNWKPKLAERSNCHGAKRVLQNDM
jgi:hypothetical protein